MYAIDFKYDNRYLSSYGFMICHFDASNGANVSDAGAKITFKKVSRNNGKSYSLTSTNYDECITATFDICKNPDLYNYEDREISSEEYRNLVRWLNRREFLKFQAFNENSNIDDFCYYNASFNINKIKIGEKLYGLRLTLETDKPFGYGQTQTVEWEISDSSTTKFIKDMSNEIGYTYPDMTITCNTNGDLSIANDTEDCIMIIKNCSKGEVITINGESQIITTTYDSHDISNDFNYDFFKIGNTIDNRNNKVSVSMPCKIVIKYTPVIKDIP